MSQADSSSNTEKNVFGDFIDNVAKRKNSEEDESCGNKKFCTTKKVVQRSFPGPAGLLTTNSDANSEKQTSWKDFSFNTSVNQMEILCSQASVAAFNTPIWRRMLQNCSESGLTEKCNIEWIKRKAAQKKLFDQKAPFLAAVIQSIEPSFSTVTLFLKDPTGEIQGHMPCKLYKKHINEILVGAVIVLKQPAVLTLNFGESHYLILTASNLVQIYYPGKNKNNNSTDVKSVELQNLPTDELLRLISDVDNHQNNKETKDCSFKTIENRQTVVTNSFKTIEHPQTVAINNLKTTEHLQIQTVINKTVERQITTEKKKKFDFKIAKEQLSEYSQKSGGDEPLSQCSQIVIKSQNPAHEKILHKVFDGVDADSFFEDF